MSREIPHQTPDTPIVLIRKAALLVTADAELGAGPLGVLEDADLVFQGNTILSVGKDLQVNGFDPAAMPSGKITVIDAQRKIVLPGFVDTHNHLWQSLIRGGGAEMELLSWLDHLVFSMPEARLTAEELAAATRFSAYDLINTGVTTVVDHSPCFSESFAEGNLRGLVESGLRFGFAYCGGARQAEHMEHLKTTVLDQLDRASLQIGAYPSMAGLQLLREQVALAERFHCPLNIHLLESQRQRSDGSFDAMDAAGADACSVIAAHAIHLTEAEITTMARNDIRVAHCPQSNMRLASGVMPFARMAAAGVKIGLGLDGGANDTSDYFATMKAAIGLQRATSLSPAARPGIVDVLRMATIEGARLLGLEQLTGSITPGKRADLMIINPNMFNFGLCWNWVNQIVLNGQPVNVEAVFVDGVPLKWQHQLVGGDHEETREAVYACVARARRELGL